MHNGERVGFHRVRHRPSHNHDRPPGAANNIYYEIALTHRGLGHGKVLFGLALAEARPIAPRALPSGQPQGLPPGNAPPSAPTQRLGTPTERLKGAPRRACRYFTARANASRTMPNDVGVGLLAKDAGRFEELNPSTPALLFHSPPNYSRLSGKGKRAGDPIRRRLERGSERGAS